jgi:carbon dioxide concentrating mechanism protein CcmL
MQLGRVVGTVVSTIKASGLTSYKLLLVSPFDSRVDGGECDDMPFVAVDLIGAGESDVVLVSQGSAARVPDGAANVPTDAAIIAIVETVRFGDQATYSKT